MDPALASKFDSISAKMSILTIYQNICSSLEMEHRYAIRNVSRLCVASRHNWYCILGMTRFPGKSIITDTSYSRVLAWYYLHDQNINGYFRNARKVYLIHIEVVSITTNKCNRRTTSTSRVLQYRFSLIFRTHLHVFLLFLCHNDVTDLQLGRHHCMYYICHVWPVRLFYCKSREGSCGFCGSI